MEDNIFKAGNANISQDIKNKLEGRKSPFDKAFDEVVLNVMNGGSLNDTEKLSAEAQAVAKNFTKLSNHPDFMGDTKGKEKQLYFVHNLSQDGAVEKLLTTVDKGDGRAIDKEIEKLFRKPAELDPKIKSFVEEQVAQGNADYVNVKDIAFKAPSFIEKAKTKIADLVDDVKDALGISSVKSR